MSISSKYGHKVQPSAESTLGSLGKPAMKQNIEIGQSTAKFFNIGRPDSLQSLQKGKVTLWAMVRSINETIVLLR